MTQRKDWAILLAEQIERDIQGIFNPQHRIELVALRLRLVRQEGIGEGIRQVEEAMK
jgi:hypothetical protein